MASKLTRRAAPRPRLDLLAVPAILATLAAGLLAPGPAQAKAPGDPKIEVSATEVAPGGMTRVQMRRYATPAQEIQSSYTDFIISPNLVAAGLQVDIDFDSPNCTGDAAGSHVRCDYEHSLFDFTPTGADGAWAVVKASAAVPVGTEGTVTAIFKGEGHPAFQSVAKVTVVEGVSLVAGPFQELSAKPGESFGVPLTVRNAGQNIADGVGMTVDASPWALKATTRYRNCRYDGERLVSCDFDQKLQPGTTYRAVVPYQLRGDAPAPTALGTGFTWRTAAQHQAYLAEQRAQSKPAGTPGNGAALTLEPVASVAAKRQADVDYRDNTTNVRIAVTGRNGVDLVALGAEVAGEAGDVVPARIGVRNDGPAVLDLGQTKGEPTVAARITLTVPQGTEVVGVPARCQGVVNGDIWWGSKAVLGAAEYVCRTSTHIEAGAAETFRFKLRINDVVEGATGQIQVADACAACEINEVNNRAQIVVNHPGGDGGGLPVTGVPIASIAVGALMLLLVGTGGVLIARRRRTRFQA